MPSSVTPTSNYVVPASGTWSAVFMIENQVFFGHITAITDSDIHLVNVYYLQTADSSTGSPSSAALTINSLVGAQIQCPVDAIILSRQGILDWQDMQPQGYVVQQLITMSHQARSCFQPAG